MHKQQLDISRRNTLLMTHVISAISLLFCLFVHGALPFLTSPTLGQAVWTTGFAQSFVNGEQFSLFATNFGAPEPAAIAFGLAGALPTSLLLMAGLHPTDAYTMMIAIWLSIAFWGAWKIAHELGARQITSSLIATLWLTMPVLWTHAGYSMVSTGMALLPLYFLSFINLIEHQSAITQLRNSLLFFVCCTIAIFMDGYSFMMFAAGCLISLFILFFLRKEYRKRLITYIFPTLGISLGMSYFLYVSYIGRMEFDASSIEFFRAWGIDLSFLVRPTSGVLWLPDALKWSIARTPEKWFGDASVWISSFLLPLILAGIYSLFPSRVHKGHSYIKAIGLCLALAGLYLALGPSLKLNSTKPHSVDSAMMAEEYALVPTGSAYLSTHVPGFRNMRASYRWIALATFGLWLLIALALGTKEVRTRKVFFLISIILIFVNLPHPKNKFLEYKNHRQSFLNLDSDLLSQYKRDTHPNEKIVFLPWSNDFLVNYLSARSNTVSFNIGGDKNLYEARLHWPLILRDAKRHVDASFTERVTQTLLEQTVDMVVIPKVDLLWAAHSWPPRISNSPDLEKALEELVEYSILTIQSRPFYTTIRLNKQTVDKLGDPLYKEQLYSQYCFFPPSCLKITLPNPKAYTKVGNITDEGVNTTNNKGVLLYGPYESLDAGEYMLTIYGFVDRLDDTKIDVVSNKATTKHAELQLTTSGIRGESIGQISLILNKAVADLEIRAFVGESDSMTITGYSVTPLFNVGEKK